MAVYLRKKFYQAKSSFKTTTFYNISQYAFTSFPLRLPNLIEIISHQLNEIILIVCLLKLHSTICLLVLTGFAG
jgi:hypothetical protein